MRVYRGAWNDLQIYLLMIYPGPDIGGPHGPYKQVLVAHGETQGFPNRSLVRKDLFIPEPRRSAAAIWACLPMFLFHRALGRLC